MCSSILSVLVSLLKFCMPSAFYSFFRGSPSCKLKWIRMKELNTGLKKPHFDTPYVFSWSALLQSYANYPDITFCESVSKATFLGYLLQYETWCFYSRDCWLYRNRSWKIHDVSFWIPSGRKTRDSLNGYQEHCDSILNDVNEALQHLDSLQRQYLFVSTKTGTLHEACEQLLKEQVSQVTQQHLCWAALLTFTWDSNNHLVQLTFSLSC